MKGKTKMVFKVGTAHLELGIEGKHPACCPRWWRAQVTRVACLTCGPSQDLPLSPENPEGKHRALCPPEGQDLALAFPRSLSHSPTMFLHAALQTKGLAGRRAPAMMILTSSHFQENGSTVRSLQAPFLSIDPNNQWETQVEKRFHEPRNSG